MLKVLCKIRYLVWSGLLFLFIWWGLKSVIRYWNQPLTTDIVYTFGDTKNGIQFPLISFCLPYIHVFENDILQQCIRTANESVWSGFIEALAICVKIDKEFEINTFMDSLEIQRKDIFKLTQFWTGKNYINLKHLEDQMWSQVFHHSFGPCHTIDLSRGIYNRLVLIWLQPSEVEFNN